MGPPSVVPPHSAPLAAPAIVRLCASLPTVAGVSVDSAVFARLCAALKSEPYQGAVLAAAAGPAARSPSHGPTAARTSAFDVVRRHETVTGIPPGTTQVLVHAEACSNGHPGSKVPL